MKERWVPKQGEWYWFVFWLHTSNRPNVMASQWMGDSTDCMKLYCGNVFPTEEEAKEAAWPVFNKMKA